MKKSFIIHQDQREIVDQLTDEQAGKLYKALFEYNETGSIPNDPFLRLAFTPIKQTIDRERLKYEEKVEKLRQNAKSKRKQLQANGSACKQTDGDSDSVNVNDSVLKDPSLSPQGETGSGEKTQKKTKKIRSFIEEFPPNYKNNQQFRMSWMSWEKHRKEKGNSITETAFSRQRNLLISKPINEAISMIEQSITNGYTGIFELRSRGSPKQPSKYKQMFGEEIKADL